ncbi:unnamed protein product [Sympodiomycopsis kandeliae]
MYGRSAVHGADTSLPESERFSRSPSPSRNTSRPSSSMSVTALNGSTGRAHQTAMDVKLPPIRSLGSFDTITKHSVPQESFPRRALDTSPSQGRSSLPPIPRFSDPRSRAEAHAPALSQHSQGYHTVSSRDPLSPGSASSARVSQQESLHQKRPLSATQSNARETANVPATPYKHPFFDRGLDSTKDGPPADAPVDCGPTSPKLESQMLRLEEIEKALRIARAIVLDGINGHVLTQASLDSAMDATGRAWSLFRDAGASQDSSNEATKHHQHAREGTNPRFDTPGALRDNEIAVPAPATVPSRSIFGLNQKPPSAAFDASSDRSGHTQRSGYDGQDIASNDNIPRPPTSVVRSNTYDQQAMHHPPVSAEKETSFMYAPSSIRKRLADMQSQQELSNSPGSVARHGDMVVERGIPPPLNPRANFPQRSVSSGILPPPPSTLSRPIPTPHHYEYDHMGFDRRLSPTESATKYKKRSRAPAPSSCKGCGTNETPEWRRGPDGARTLCNACGLHFAKLAKKKPSAPEDEPDPGYHPHHSHGVGPIDPSHKSIFG